MKAKIVEADLLSLAMGAQLSVVGQIGTLSEDGRYVVVCGLEDPIDLEWQALPILFALAALAFADAKPHSQRNKNYQPDDVLDIADFLTRLRYLDGALEWSVDGLRGRRVNILLNILTDGRIRIETKGRGDEALSWIQKISLDQSLSSPRRRR